MNNWFKMSGIGNLNWRDLLHAIYLSVGTIALSWLLSSIPDIKFSSNPVVNEGIINTLSFALTYLLKQLGSDSKGNLFGIGSK